MNTKKLALALLVAVAFAILGQTNAQAAPLCTNTLLSTLETETCQSSDGIFFLNFLPTTGLGRSTPDTSITVTVTTNITDTQLQVTYTPTSTLGSTGGSMSLDGYNFEYTVAVPSGATLTAMNILINNPVVTSAGDAVSGFKKVTQTGDQASTGTLNNPANNNTPLTGSLTLPTPLMGSLTIEDSITLAQFDALGTGTATTGSIVNTLTLVPEPLTTVLCGIGLLGFGLFRKRLKR